jgi:hypothetical protein
VAIFIDVAAFARDRLNEQEERALLEGRPHAARGRRRGVALAGDVAAPAA